MLANLYAIVAPHLALEHGMELGSYHLLAERTYPVYKHLAIKVVELVLAHNGKIAFYPFFVLLELLVLIAHAYAFGPTYILMYARKTKAALLVVGGFSVVELKNVRIYEYLSETFILRKVVGYYVKVYNYKPYGAANLRSSEADAIALAERIPHVLYELGQPFVVGSYVLGHFSQHRLTVNVNWKYHLKNNKKG